MRGDEDEPFMLTLLQKWPWQEWLPSPQDEVSTTIRQREPNHADLSQKDVTLYVTLPLP